MYLASILWSRVEAAPRIAVVTAGSCPARDAVIAALAQAMPDATIAGDAPADAGDAEPVVVVSDESASYRAVVGGVMRTLVDAPGNCAERARKVAIVTALALAPAVEAPRSPEPSASLAAVLADPPPAATVVPRSAIGLRFEGGVVRDYGWLGPSSGTPAHRLLALGGTGRLTIGRGPVGVVVGGALSTRSAVVGSLVQRIPVDVLVQVRHREGWIAGAVELGPSFVFQRAERDQADSVNFETDLRFSGRIELWFARSAGVYAAATGTYIPNPAPLTNAGADAYAMPHRWLAVSSGLVIQIQ